MGTNDLFINIAAENFQFSPSLEKGRDMQVQAFRHQTGSTRKETPPKHIIIKTLNIQNKRILKAAKEKQQVI
jgi:hypothetical protein